MSLRLSISLSLGGKELIHHSIIRPFSRKASRYRGCGLLDRNKGVPVPAKRVLFDALGESELCWIPARGTALLIRASSPSWDPTFVTSPKPHYIPKAQPPLGLWASVLSLL